MRGRKTTKTSALMVKRRRLTDPLYDVMAHDPRDLWSPDARSSAVLRRDVHADVSTSSG